ncbi:ceramide-1-phosphate transfer protein [Adelges cooleyi]|uniref:ceramide-1-phosphate transfer protein n=1 Tax=Adelges cooleyi TaxID=133065 RepID=UPI00217F6408|nr:ceramide-1-phosphate transfer protein [Adelges cooleyi]XP_050429006.1 ceramide-1-phosphate transfer protein [Adelges cooleyi]XP_050429007.1 ceramide-1-phosphate transfer protein [Adelges cooleyi]
MFNVSIVRAAFHEAMIHDEDVDIRNYIIAYKELSKFCSQLGTIFNFVVKDIEDKLWRLNELMRQDNSNFVTVKAMILYERSNGELAHNSGCITLLRLHRGLDFIVQFMTKLCQLEPKDSTSSSAIEAYDITLAKHHSWLIRTGARMAMKFLPNQETLYHQAVGESNHETSNTMPDMISKASLVHHRVNRLFLDYEILHLP